MSPDVHETEPDGIDYGWVMQTTFVLSIVVGAPLIALLSIFADLPTWNARATFAIQVGAAVWLVLGLSVYGYARRFREKRSEKPETAESDASADCDEPADGSEPDDEKSASDE